MIKSLRGLLVLGAATLLWAAAPVESPVADAAMRKDVAAVRALLEKGADVNAAQGDGMTALHWAAHNGDAEMARMLMYAGAHVDAVTRNGNYTPLHLASKTGSALVIKALLDAGADPNAASTTGGATPLHLAAAQGDKASIEALLLKKATVDAREAFGETPLMWAAAYNRVPAIEALVARGADINATSKVENVPEREKADRAAQQVRNRRVAALKAADQPAGRGGGGAAQGGASGRGGAPGAAAQPGEPGGGGGGNRGGGGGGGRGAAGDTTSANRSLSYGELVGNKGGLTPLLFAVRQGNTQSALALLKLGAKINLVS